MKSIVAFSLLLAVALAYPSDGEWEDAEVLALKGIQNRIIGGEAALPRQFPYQVRLHLTKVFNGKLVSSLCGGSIISNTAILTAAHCLRDAVGGMVYMGVTNMRVKESTGIAMVLKPENFVINARYNPYAFVHDIALVLLPKPVEYNSGIQPINLARASQTNLENKMAVISGFGKTGDKMGPSDVLRYVQRQILPKSHCQVAFPGTFQDTMICVDGSEKKSACPGDSGGPLAITEADGTKTLVGLTSFGKMSCEMGSPAVYTRISSYLDWIKKYTGIPVKN